MARSVAHTATRPALSLAIDPSALTNPPCFANHAARHTRSRAASISVAMSASMKAIAWCCTIGGGRLSTLANPVSRDSSLP